MLRMMFPNFPPTPSQPAKEKSEEQYEENYEEYYEEEEEEGDDESAGLSTSGKKKWTIGELEKLCELTLEGNVNWDEVSTALCRSKKECQNIYSLLSNSYGKNPWTIDEILFVIKEMKRKDF